MTDDRPVLTVGVDPGKSAGVSALLDHARYRAFQGKVDTPAGLEEFDWFLRDLFAEARQYDWRLLVACERFVVSGRTARLSQQPHAQTIMGRVVGMSPTVVYLQSVSDATRFASNERLRYLGLWTTPAMVGQPDADDANSATRHALLLLARKAARQYRQLVDDTSGTS